MRKKIILVIVFMLVSMAVLRHSGHRYQNPINSPNQQAKLTDFVRFFWQQAQRQDEVIPTKWQAVAKQDVLKAIQQPTHPQLTWLGHSSFLIQAEQVTLLTDPFFSERASPVSFAGPKRIVPSPLTLDQLPNIDIILISHNHYDHMDAPTLKVLARQQPLIFVPPGDEDFIRSLGFQRVVTLQWYEDLNTQGLHITALPAIHFSARGLFDRNRSLWESYAIDFNHFSLFFSCDTGYGPLYPQLGKTWHFDYALLPIGAYEPKSIMSAVHITPEEAIQIAKDLHVKTLIPMHWGTIPMAQEPLFAPIDRLKEQKPQLPALTLLRVGETTPLHS